MCHFFAFAAFAFRSAGTLRLKSTLDASTAGYITSPGYPLEYPPHQNCHWMVTAPEPSQRIVLNFNPHFEMRGLQRAGGREGGEER
ncbi:hypothetical protein CRUP_032439 [Coryphaenoides rupestris]|nr:hypothetical protein CRUP_032439 [Coryphaenoides rupestris]